MSLPYAGEIIEDKNSNKIGEILDCICRCIKNEHRKGKIPLFIIGSGVSSSLKDSAGNSLNGGIPDMVTMVGKLRDISASYSLPEELGELFSSWDKKKKDRSIVSKILMHFEEPVSKELQQVWSEFIDWLLYRCVDEEKNIGMTNAKPSLAHEKIAEMYSKANAICLTINFDSLLYKALSKRFDKFDEQGKLKERKAYTYFDPKKCEDFFKRLGNDDVVVEIQARGDVFWAECRKNPLCDVRRERTPLLAFEEFGLGAEDPTKCRCGAPREILIAFPGTYEKDRIMQEIFSTIWRYLAYKISCVITLGFSGVWDPILIAFISDLLGEREIPLIDVNVDSEGSDLVKELIQSQIFNAVGIKQIADNFMEKFVGEYENCRLVPISFRFESCYEDIGNDYHWDRIFEDLKPSLNEITPFEEEVITNPLVRISNKFTQLGLKSRWLGVDKGIRKDHNRLSHSKGVMKIASFIYEEACKRSNRQYKDNEKEFLRIGALLHDIGHLPFCHLIEEIFKELNWKPSGYVESFGHGLHTEGKIEELLKQSDLERYLKQVGYQKNDLIKLINGEFGVGFLDAILNSPIDADKIEYVFRDARSTGTPISLDEKVFLSGLVEETQITPEGLLAFSGYSAKLAMALLDTRQSLYSNLYLTPEVRFLESAVRFIISTYFVHRYNTIEWGKISKAVNYVKTANARHGIADLGALRIQLAIDDLEELVKNNKGKEDIELAILEEMKEVLLTKPIRGEVSEALLRCYEMVSTIDTKEKLLQAESEHLMPREELEKVTGGPVKRIKDARKTVILRFPGVLLIDVVPSRNRLSIAEKRRKKPRSDSTFEYAECILVPSGNVRDWRRGRDRANTSLISANSDKAEPPKIYMYRIGKGSDANQAVDLFVRLLREEKMLEEVE